MDDTFVTQNVESKVEETKNILCQLKKLVNDIFLLENPANESLLELFFALTRTALYYKSDRNLDKSVTYESSVSGKKSG